MDEPRDPPRDDGTRPPLIASATRLSPIQQAYSRFTRHSLDCDTCRDVDRGHCDQAEQLWRAYQEQGADAFRRLKRS